ncbi:MAG: hypothetical protein HKN75_08320 [Bacteroidia bacterium]|nr:hypothetical protein [Bacteroidia bacterium]
MPLSKLPLLFLFVFISQLAHAQNTVNLLNGKIIEVKQFEINGEKITFIKTDDEKDKTKKISKYKIFSIVDSLGAENVVYTRNASVLGEMNVDEMRHFMLGEQFALKHYDKDLNKYVGLATGLTGGVIGFYGLFVPPVYAIVNERVAPPIKYPKDVELPDAADHDYFLYGYNKRAANMKMRDTFVFGGIGLAVGITTFVLVFDN